MEDTRQLGFEQSREILEQYGIPILGRMAGGLEELLAAAEEIGYPVVIKAVTAEVVHKTDMGAVILNLRDAQDLRRAHQALLDRLAQAGVQTVDGILIQKMVDHGFELLVGAKQDPVFGPVTMVGQGGQYVELFKDVSPGIGVLSAADVEHMLRQTKAGQIIDGFRQEPLDKAAVVDVTVRVSKLMSEHPEIREIDLNPVIVYENGVAIVDARVIAGEPVARTGDCQVSPRARQSLDAIFNLNSVAVVGASRTGTMGGIILKNCRRVPKVFPINPRLDSVQGLKCHPSLSACPEVPEVAVFAVNPQTTVEGFEEFCRLGGKGAIIFTDGFAEVGRHDLEQRLVQLSREYGVSYIGPNCMGVIDNFSGLSTLFIAEHRTSNITEPNGIGVISQSGGIGLELLEMLEADGLRVGKWVSCGNASSVGVPEILDHMGRDPNIKVIAIYMEGVADGLKLMEVGREVTKTKPVIMIKGGMAGGAEATLSHTASLAGSNEAFKACCSQAGFYLIEELIEDPKILINVLSMLTTMPKATGNRVGVVSVGGGAAILLADQVTQEGLELASFAPETRDRLRTLLRDNMHVANDAEREAVIQGIGRNPLDLFGNCDDSRLLEALRIVDQDPNTDIIVAAIYLQVPYLSEYIAERLVELKGELSKPLIVSPRGFSDYVSRTRNYLRHKNFSTYTVPMMKPMKIAMRIWCDYGKSFYESRPSC